MQWTLKLLYKWKIFGSPIALSLPNYSIYKWLLWRSLHAAALWSTMDTSDGTKWCGSSCTDRSQKGRSPKSCSQYIGFLLVCNWRYLGTGRTPSLPRRCSAIAIFQGGSSAHSIISGRRVILTGEKAFLALEPPLWNSLPRKACHALSF